MNAEVDFDASSLPCWMKEICESCNHLRFYHLLSIGEYAVREIACFSIGCRCGRFVSLESNARKFISNNKQIFDELSKVD